MQIVFMLVQVALRAEAKVLAAGCWDRGFESRFGHGWLSC